MLRSSWEGRLQLLDHHGLLAVQDGSGCGNGGHAPISAVLVLADHVPDAADGGPAIVALGGLQVGGSGFSPTGSLLPGHHYTFAVRSRLHAQSLAVNQPV